MAVVALAAFLAGAVVQRAILGDFALKLGPLEVPELRETAAASAEALDEIKAELGRQAKATGDAMRVAAASAERVDAIGLALEPLLGPTLGEEERNNPEK